MRKCVVAIGHQPTGDMGAVSPDGTTREWPYNNDIARILPLLTTKAEVVVVTRKSFAELPGQINAHKPDFCVELHFNAVDDAKAHGTETLFWYASCNGNRLAETFQAQMLEALKLRNRGTKPVASAKARGGHYLSKTVCPAVLVEPGFITNDTDRRALIERKIELARAYAAAIDEYARTL